MRYTYKLQLFILPLVVGLILIISLIFTSHTTGSIEDLQFDLLVAGKGIDEEIKANKKGR